jgi:membrane protease YdiL (CAAX protease family)
METDDRDSIPEVEVGHLRRRKAVAAGLLLASVLGSLAVFPFVYLILKQAGQPERSAVNLLPALGENVAVGFLFSIGAVTLWTRLGKSVGLGEPLLDGWPAVDQKSRRRIRNALLLAGALGIGIGVLDVMAEYVVLPGMAQPRVALTSPPAWAGLLASVGAGITEEIWFRLGLMTLFVWMGARDARRFPPSARVVWTGNVVAAVLFGAIHLPQAALLIGLNPALVAFVLLANALPGIVFGWLYWRRGLVAAMVSHCAADVVLKVVLPLLGLD